MLKIKQLLLLLLSLATIGMLAGCSDDGDTSGSAESNGVISKESNDPVTQHSSEPEGSKDLGDMLSDVFSGIESGASDLVSDAKDTVSDWMDDLSEAASDLMHGDDRDK